MNLIGKARLWSLTQKIASEVAGCLLGATCVVLFILDTGTSIGQATTNPKSYVGIWRMTVQDKRIGTLELINYHGRLTGSLTNGHATMDANGKLVEFDAIPGAAPIVQASISQDLLVIDTEEVAERITTWNMALTGEGKANLQLTVKGHEMGPIQLTRISWEELESESGK
jgi:hypothetical protein